MALAMGILGPSYAWLNNRDVLLCIKEFVWVFAPRGLGWVGVWIRCTWKIAVVSLL